MRLDARQARSARPWGTPNASFGYARGGIGGGTDASRLRGALPYRDIIQAPNDLAENRPQLLMASYAAMRRLIQPQKLKLLAVTSRKRIDDADAALLSKLTQSAQQVVRHCDR